MEEERENRLEKIANGQVDKITAKEEIIEWSNLFWEIVYHEETTVIARRIKKDGSLGKESLGYDVNKQIRTMHRYKH